VFHCKISIDEKGDIVGIIFIDIKGFMTLEYTQHS
jgi:hypothetical protein